VENAVLDLRQVVEQGYWLFVNLPYAFLSDTTTTVLGNLLITRILYACMQRPPGSRPYRLILDEARFFNSGPLEIILETSRAYNLWLTLVVQSIDQFCRSREGRVDERLKETVLNLCRYYSIFHSTQDGELLARLMFPLTGRVITGIRADGGWEYLPVPAELDEQRRLFMKLRSRQRIFWDKLGDEPPRIWRTPDVVMDPPDERIVQDFEADHLARIGRLISAISHEIERRKQQLEDTYFAPASQQQTAREEPHASGRSRAQRRPPVGEPLNGR
jgi:hypothetical protein